MIIGIGTDIIEQARVRKACEKAAFLMRVYTEQEQELIRERPGRAAGNWAAKEAVAKVFGTGFSGVSPREIEVLRDEAGAPYVRLCGGAAAQAERLGILRLHVSISDTKEYACAFAVGENGGRDEISGGQ